MTDVHTVVDSYADLLARHPRLHRRFQKRRREKPESALAEAMTFSVLQQCGVKPEIADQLNIGGPDFRCTGIRGEQFMVEATSFEPDKVTKDTSIENEPSPGLNGQAYDLLTRQLEEKAGSKRRQFDQLQCPGILAIASSHLGSSLVLDAYAANNALISQPFWVVNEEGMSTDLASSLFLRLEDNGEITERNQSISAILLVSVTGDRSYVCGALNPAATRKLKSESLWMVPFVYLKDWPIEGRSLRCEWTMGSLRSYEVEHKSIRASESGLGK
jgi:hypothetical protein